MSKLFEISWTKNYVNYERVFNTETNKSEINTIKLASEWFEEDSRGKYKNILDSSVILDKKQGNAKDGRNHFGFIDPIYRNIRDNYWNEHQSDTFNKHPRIFYLDIETRVGTNSVGFPHPDKAAEPITLIQIFDSVLDTIIVFGLREWKHEKDYKFKYKTKYILCCDEIDLMNKFLKTFKTLNPLIIYAWNGSGFDFPYIYNRMKLLGMDTNQLSNYGNTKLKENKYGQTIKYDLVSDGHFFSDLLDVYKKFTFGEQASYSLDFTAELLLGNKKVQHTEYVAFDDFYTGKYVIPTKPTEEQKNSKIYKEAINGNWDEVKELAHSDFVYYGFIDVVLIKEIDEVKNFTQLMIMIAEKMGVQISDSMGTVKPWAKYIANKALLNKEVIPRMHVGEEEISIKGGYVADPQVGKHKWILSSDVNSMYPLLGMVAFNNSPETYIPIHKLQPDIRTIILKYYNNENEEERFNIPENIKLEMQRLLKKYNYSLGVNGAIFTKDKLGIVPEMVLDIYNARKQDKKTMFEYEKKSLEIKEILKQRTKSA